MMGEHHRTMDRELRIRSWRKRSMHLLPPRERPTPPPLRGRLPGQGPPGGRRMDFHPPRKRIRVQGHRIPQCRHSSGLPRHDPRNGSPIHVPLNGNVHRECYQHHRHPYTEELDTYGISSRHGLATPRLSSEERVPHCSRHAQMACIDSMVRCRLCLLQARTTLC